MNRKAALEWLMISYHDLRSAQILYEVNHYTDSIGSDLQQSIEKTLKSIIAFENKKIPKTHDLYEVYILTKKLNLDNNDIKLLYIATEYLKEERYPNPQYSLPSREEIKNVLTFAEEIFENVCMNLGIKLSEIIQEK